jgi:hypothetical protein
MLLPQEQHEDDDKIMEKYLSERERERYRRRLFMYSNQISMTIGMRKEERKRDAERHI